jgi:uncharacterized protein
MIVDSRRYHMRRKDKEVTDLEAINEILKDAKICHLGFIDNNEPYIVPVNFGYEENHIYFHSALEGRKVDIIKKYNKVCFNVITGFQVKYIPPDGCTMKYKSVSGVGTPIILKDPEEKIRGLKTIMRQSLGHEFKFPLERLDSVLVVRIDIQEITGKQAD